MPALELESLSAAHREEQSVRFDRADFYRKISWAQAELTVALDLVERLLANQTLSIASITKHNNHGTGRQTFRSVSRINCRLAKSLFQRAAEKLKAVSQAQEGAEIEVLLGLGKLGWPLFKHGHEWLINYGFEGLLNLPYNPKSVVPVTFDASALTPRLVLPQRKMGKLVIGTDGSAKFCLFEQLLNSLELGNEMGRLHAQLQTLRLCDLDFAIFNCLKRTFSRQIIFPPNFDDCFRLDLGEITLNVQLLVENGDILMQQDTASDLFTISLTMYRSFLQSRGEEIKLQ